MVNLSEALWRVPGLTVANRNNYAQDLQISSRGYRRTRRLRRARPAAVHRRHPGHDARRPGPGGALRSRGRLAHRGAARPVLGAVRQQLGRRDRVVHRTGHRARGRSWRSTPAASGCGRSAISLSLPMDAGLRPARQPDAVRHRRLSTAERCRPHARQRAAGLARRCRHGDRAAVGSSAERAGSAGPDTPAVQRRPVADHAAGHPVRHAQVDQPDAGRRQLAPPLRRRARRWSKPASPATSARARSRSSWPSRRRRRHHPTTAAA